MYVIVFYIFPSPLGFPAIISLSLAGFLYLLFLWRANISTRILFITVIPFAALALIFNTYFYPKVLTYQTGPYVAKQLNETAPDSSKILIYKDYHSFSMQFYSKFPIVEHVGDQALKSCLVRGKTFILADTSYVKEILNIDPEIKITGRYYSHSPTLLSWGFLNPATREANVDHRVLMKY